MRSTVSSQTSLRRLFRHGALDGDLLGDSTQNFVATE